MTLREDGATCRHEQPQHYLGMYLPGAHARTLLRYPHIPHVPTPTRGAYRYTVVPAGG